LVWKEEKMSCIFCKIVDAEIPAKVVYEDESTLAFLDIKPINPGHMLIIPKDHAESLEEITAGHLGKMTDTAKKIAGALKQTPSLKCEGVNLFLADGKAAGQEVFHVHLHLIPRYSGDGFGLNFPTHYGKIPAAEIDAVAQRLRALLSE
jgi:histidine triad (HIT) family protein